MRESNLSPIAPTSIISQVHHNSIQQHLLIAEKKAEKTFTHEEAIYYITHHVNNIKLENGRICMSLDRKGNLHANSVSPYSEKFLDNIEDGVKKLVLAFHNKRYLTYSSCEGHNYTFRRYVGLAFADSKSREYVSTYIKNLNIIGVKVNLLSSVINQTINFNSIDNFKYVGKINIQSDDKTNIENEIKTFNIQFHRNYENFYFLEIIILEEFDPKDKYKYPLKACYLFIMKKLFWNYLTNKVICALNKPEFKKYMY